MKTLVTVLAAATVMGLTGSAQAQVYPGRMVDRWGVSASLGGGVANFTGNTASDSTGVAGLWDVRIVAGHNRRFGGELGYSGTAQSIDAIGLDPSANLISNGVDADLRFNILEGALQPYLTAGLGWRLYGVNSDFNTSDVSGNDNVLEIPVAAGLAYQLKKLVLDARFTFRPTLDEDLFQNGALHTWALSARAGYRF